MKDVKYMGKNPEYIDGFPEDCARSCEGAIHLMPGSLKSITDDEFNFIKKKFTWIKLAEYCDKPQKVKSVPTPAPVKFVKPLIESEKKFYKKK